MGTQRRQKQQEEGTISHAIPTPVTGFTFISLWFCVKAAKKGLGRGGAQGGLSKEEMEKLDGAIMKLDVDGEEKKTDKAGSPMNSKLAQETKAASSKTSRNKKKKGKGGKKF